MDSSCKPVQYHKHDFRLLLAVVRAEIKFIRQVIAMNRLKGISPGRVLPFIATLSGAMGTTMLVPAYGQQEVDVAWYDPVPNTGPSAMVVHPCQPTVLFHQRQAAAKGRQLRAPGTRAESSPQPKQRLWTARAETGIRKKNKHRSLIDVRS
jgi:hypothetical protein